MPNLRMTGLIAGACALLAAPFPALAQSEVMVFAPFRGIATPIARAGSAVSVITRQQIEQAGQVSVAEILRASAGVSFSTAGGFGATTDVRIRGAESQHTMVLIDGIPITDPTSTRNDVDFTMIAASTIERIEVLRGPQSALYGSDAVGGVIAITTRQAGTGLSGSASTEGGSFGTMRQGAVLGYGGQRFSFSGNLEHISTEGFSRRSGNSEVDGSSQWTGGLRGQLQLGEGLELDASLQITDLETDYDRTATDPAGLAQRQGVQGHLRASHEAFDGRWRQTLSASASTTERRFTEGASVETYEGSRLGLDYTGQINLDSAGTLLYGASVEQQGARYVQAGALRFDQQEVYWGAFALYQLSLGPQLHVSAALRWDDFASAGGFMTGRATAVYEVPASETRLHASIGTAAKAPSLRQRAATPTLRPEESVGMDAGITQTLFDGRLTADVTGFYQEITDMHLYTGGFGGFASEAWANISRAELYGLELSVDARLIPGQIDMSANYTYLDARDASTDQWLPRRPQHQAQLRLSYIGMDRLNLSATLNWVGGERYSSTRERLPLAAYARIDVDARYRVHDHLEIYGRIENLTDVTYEEISGYNTPGLSAYAGLRASF